MRRSAVLTTLALAASTLLLAQPASAMRPLDAQPSRDRAAKLSCPTAVFGVDSTGRLTYDEVKNHKVITSTRSKAKLGFDVTAWGFYDSTKRTIRFDTVTDSGTPRRVSATVTTKGKIALAGSTKYSQSNFEPRLFADNFGYFAYTVDNRGKLARWSLTRYPDGRTKFAQKVGLGSGYDDLTSLQSSAVYEIKGSLREVLYGTTAGGALVQLVVPVKKPLSYKKRTLAVTGYAGVTELSWSYCNDKGDYHSLIAVDGDAGTATWTTIKDAAGKPNATLHGAVAGGKGWDLVAAI
jgi:hypothetical protein